MDSFGLIQPIPQFAQPIPFSSGSGVLGKLICSIIAIIEIHITLCDSVRTALSTGGDGAAI